MTLNASGPISLGGATVGQSVNLELGNSATALASINSTQFRTLAGVPSGTIALSNFYGKSNASYYLTYLGYNGSSAGNARKDSGFAVSTSSGQPVVPFYWSGTNGIATLSATGGLQSTYELGNTSISAYSIRMPLNNYGASDRVYVLDSSNRGINYFTTASPGTLGWSSQPCSGLSFAGDGLNTNYDGSTIGVTSSGRVLYVGWYQDPKAGFINGVWPAESNGTQSTGGVWTDFGYGVGSYLALAVKTDSTPVIFAGTYIYVFPSNLTSTGSIPRYNAGGISSVGSAMCDSSNNMWVQCNGYTLQKVNAAFSSYTRYSFGPFLGGTINVLYGSAIYNDTIYMVGRYTTGSTSTNKSVVVWAFNTSTATVTWAKSITITSGTSLEGGNAYRSMVANSSGVYVMLLDINAGLNQLYVLKLPLNGTITNNSYTLGGDTFTFATPAGFTTAVQASGSISLNSNVPTFQQSAFSLQSPYTLTSRSGALTSLTTTPVT